MVYGLGLILLLAFMGGVIAYVGDRIGMKVGKNRLSLLGLRPKYTSIIITILTGILIALISLGVLAGVSYRVRLALFSIDSLLERIDVLNQQVMVGNQSLVKLEDEIKIKSEELDKLTEQIDNLSYNIKLFGKEYLSSLTAEVIYKKGEIIIREKLTKDKELSDKLNLLIEEAENKAQEKGVKSLIYSRQELNEIIEILRSKEVDMSISLIAVRNVFSGDNLLIGFDLQGVE